MGWVHETETGRVRGLQAKCFFLGLTRSGGGQHYFQTASLGPINPRGAGAHQRRDLKGGPCAKRSED